MFYRMKCENSSVTIYGIVVHLLPWQLQYVYKNWQVLHIGLPIKSYSSVLTVEGLPLQH